MNKMKEITITKKQMKAIIEDINIKLYTSSITMMKIANMDRIFMDIIALLEKDKEIILKLEG